MLGSLQGDADVVERAELAGPHTRGVDDDLGLDTTLRRQHRAHPATFGLDTGDGDTLEDPCPKCFGALGHRGGDTDRISAALVGHVEPGQHIGGVQQGPHLLQFTRADLVFRDAESVHPGRRATQRVEALRTGGQADMADRIEPGGVTRLGFKAFIEVA